VKFSPPLHHLSQVTCRARGVEGRGQWQWCVFLVADSQVAPQFSALAFNAILLAALADATPWLFACLSYSFPTLGRSE